MKLTGSTGSPFARKCRATVIEAGLRGRVEVEFISVLADGASANLANPLGLIPVLETDEGPLYDSRVICEYLDGAGDGDLFPIGDDRFPALRAQALADGVMDATVKTFFEGRRDADMRSAYWLDRWHAATVRALAAMDTDREGFDIGHLATACALEYLDLRRPEFDWRAEAGELAAWLESMRERESLKATRPS